MKPITSAPWRKDARKAAREKVPDGVDLELRDLVHARAKGQCDCCGSPLRTWDPHHRLLKSRGGQDTPANLLALCRTCHRRVHGHPAWSTEHGFMLPTGTDPANAPVALHCERWVLLDDTGGLRSAA